MRVYAQEGFVPLRNYTTLKRVASSKKAGEGFVPLRNYTTLKRMAKGRTSSKSFVPLRNYTTLKPQISSSPPFLRQHAEKAVTGRRREI